jgi:methyltransferase-like protein/2-polyprenyl-3-methyl-5-hydroxy-6-metoxy-1,4-benzoquinol methylase
MSQETIERCYDELPYTNFPFPQTHPDRLASVATLFGMSPPDVVTCRVLELGCASGGNLIPMAVGLPQGEFFGIDLSGRHITDGRAVISALGQQNVQLEQMDILDLPRDIGEFDYIIAHGVYSWVPPDVRTELLAICKRHLKPNGVAYVSYNVYPGWHTRSIIRDTMLYDVANVSEPLAQVQRGTALISFLANVVPKGLKEYSQIIKDNLQLLRNAEGGANYVFHDYLEPFNAPVYFYQFAEHAAEHGLQFLAEADIAQMQDGPLSDEGREALAEIAKDRLEREQYLDFLKNRSFRETLLCHDDVVLEHEPRTDRLRSMRFSADLNCTQANPDLAAEEPLKFTATREVTYSASRPEFRAALLILGEIQPRSISFEELHQAACKRVDVATGTSNRDRTDDERSRDVLAEELIHAYQAGIVELHVHSPQLALEVGELPAVSPLARLQSQSDGVISNLLHKVVGANPVNRNLLSLMDGTRTRDDLFQAILESMTGDDIVIQKNGRVIDETEALHAICEEELERHLKTALSAGLLMPNTV